MNKQQHISILNRQIKIGEEIMQVAIQNYEAAARSVSEAKSALGELGASPGRARRGKFQLSEETKLALRASITQVKEFENRTT